MYHLSLYWLYYCITNYIISYIFLLFIVCIGFKDISTLLEKFYTLFWYNSLASSPQFVLSLHTYHTTAHAHITKPLDNTASVGDFRPPPRGWSGAADLGTPHPPTTHNPKKPKSTHPKIENKTKKAHTLTRYRHTHFRPLIQLIREPQTYIKGICSTTTHQTNFIEQNIWQFDFIEV